MNTSNTRQPSGPECARYESLLPQFRQGTLTPAEDRSLRAHLATCAYCQAQLATYDRLDAALYSYIDHYAPTTPSADDVARTAVARVPLSSPAEVSVNHHESLGMTQREHAMFDSSDTNDDEITLTRTGYRPPNNTRTRPVLATIAALLLIGLAAGIFTVIARGTHSPAFKGNPTATAQSTATIQPTEQPTQNSTSSAVNSGHPCSTDTSGQTTYTRIGDLKVSQVGFASPYPANQIPANLDTSKPYRLPDNLPNPPNPPVNPPASYSLTICNTSATTSHVIRSFTVRIATFKAYSGPLNTYQFCDLFYQRPMGVTGGGCGGGMTLDEQLQASFAADATTGAQVTTTQVTAPNAPPLPVSLGPGQMLIFVIDMKVPTAPGTYTFAFGLNYDNVTAAPIATTQPTIFDSAAVKWTGSNCTKPALLSQIPASDTTGKYVCAP